MSEKRFVLIEDDLEPLILDNKETMSVNEVVDVLNEQQATIQELERKLKKYAKIGEEQLKQIIGLQEENEKLRKELEDE